MFKLPDKVPDLTEYAIELIKDKRYCDSANIVATFSLQSKVNMQELLTKLIAQNDILHAKSLVQTSKEYKMLLINLLTLHDNHKRTAMLIKEYGFSIFDFPKFIVRLQKKTAQGYTNALFHHKETERISLDQIIDLLENYKLTQILLIDDLISHKKYKEAWILLNYFDVSKYFLTYQSIKEKISEPENILKQFKEKLVDKYEPITEGAFKMPCTFEEVIFIDNDAELDKAQGLSKAEVISISVEWRPALMSFVEIKPSILQVVSEKIFIIFDLNKLESSSMFSELIKNLFMSMSILKLGIGLKKDMKLIYSKYTSMTCFNHMFNYIDIADFYKEQNPHEKQCSLPNILKKLLSKV